MWRTPFLVGYSILLFFNVLFVYPHPILLLITALGWLVIGEALMRALTTELAEKGFSQRTLRGRKYIASENIEKVTRDGGGYWVTGNGVKLLLRTRLFEDVDAARTFIQERLPAAQMEHPEIKKDSPETPTSLWLPGKFVPKPASRVERFWVRYSPPGWEYLPYVALLIGPGALLDFAISLGHSYLGAIGWIVWLPILWVLLVMLHQDGRLRIWLSLPLVLLAYAAIGVVMFGVI